MNRSANFSGILGETANLIGGGLPHIGLFVLALGTVNALGPIAGLAEASDQIVGFNYAVNANYGAVGALYQLVALIFSFVASYFLIAKLLGTRGLLHAGGTRIWAYVGMSILSGIAMVFGLLLVIVPGIVLWARWSAATGFLVGEGQGVTDALSSSWEATRGHSWAIFFAGLVVVVGLLILGGALGASAALGASNTIGLVLSGFAEAFANAVLAAFGIAIYVLVRGESHIEDVFA